MIEEGKYCLNNTDFEISTANVHRNLHNNKNFIDVTIACEDGKQLRAQKIILSSASLVFEKMSMDYSDSNLLLYFGDTSYEHIEYIMCFVYLAPTSTFDHLSSHSGK